MSYGPSYPQGPVGHVVTHHPQRRSSGAGCGIVALIAGALALLLVIVLVVVLVFVFRVGRSGPEDVVEDFFQALQDGDAEEALSFGDISELDAGTGVLPSEAYTQPISSFTVQETNRFGSFAYVTVGYTADGEQTSTEFSVEEVDGDWWIGRIPFETMSIYAAQRGALTINGVPIDTTVGSSGGADSVWRVAVMPGVYEISFADSPLYRSESVTTAAGPTTVIGTGLSGDSVSPRAIPEAGLQGELVDRVEEAIGECLEAGTDADYSCPARFTSIWDIEDVDYTFDSKPVYAIEDSHLISPYAISEGEGVQFVFSTSTKGRVTASGTFVNGPDAGRSGEDSMDYSASGTVIVNGGEVTVEFD